MEFLEHFRFLYDGVAYFFKSNPVLTEDGVQMVPGWKYLVMFVIGGLLIYLALVKDFEPALLMPMGFGAILVNIPFSGAVGAAEDGSQGIIDWLFNVGITASEALPLLLFIGIGAMIDFGPLLSNPKMFLFGAAAQFGIFFTVLVASFFFPFKDAAAIGIIGAMALGFAACGGNGGSDTIAVISREEGSGTRGAFVELTGVEVDKVDKTVATAEISSSTAVVMQTVTGNKAAIGYISLGSLDSSVKAVKVDGVEATADNVKNGTYPICRPFNIATKGDLSDAAKDFIAFIQSDEGQQVVTDKGCVSTGSTGAFTSSNPTGTVVVEGSSSVTPVMEKLAEAYMALNSGVTVKVQQSDSSTGMTSAIEGLCDIGMASREVKDSEKEQGLEVTTICMDGIAVVVNNDSTVDNLSLEQIRQIFTGEVTGWSAVK